MPLRYALLLLSLLLPLTSLAQDTAVLQGVVRDASTNEPIPGANVILPGLARGAATDVDGTYRIASLPAGTYAVEARFVGYSPARATVTVTAGATVTQDFGLEEDRLLLDEVVVTGTGGAIEKRKLSADVAVLNIADIEQAPVTSVDQLLQGRVAGASVRLQSAQPGQGALVNLRGITSVVSSQTPVIYVDGVRVDNASSTSFSGGGEITSAVAELLTNDIERIEITKGGAASTLYGSEAANGVIQIFTKKGNLGRPTITLRTEQGIDTPTDDFLNDTGFSFASAVEDAESPDFGQGSFLRDEFLKNGYYQDYYAGVNGGADGLRYNVSGRVQNGTGVQPGNDNTFYAVRGNVVADVTPRLNVAFSGSYTRNNFARIYNGTSVADPITSFEVGDAYFFTGTSSFEDALDIFLLPRRIEGVNRYLFSTRAEYVPSDLFRTSLVVGIDSRDNEQRLLDPAGADIVTGFTDGALTRYDRNFSGITLDYRATISYPREGRVTSDFTAGVQGFREDVSIVTATGETFALPGTEDFGEAGDITADEERSEIFNGGVLFQERLGLFDRLFIDAGLRLDGNSAFGEDIGLQAYPSVGVAYSASEEAFWSGTFGRYWPELKLRAAYGATGNFPTPFARDATFEAIPFRSEAAPRFDNPGNLELEPERTETFEAGVETTFFTDRVGLMFTYYTSVTDNAFFLVPEQPATGRGTQLRNVGTIENRGVELAISTSLLDTGTFFWEAGFNFGWNDNEVTRLGGAPDFNIFDATTYGAQQRVTEGEPVGVWRARVPIDTNGDGLLDDVEFQVTGWQPFPSTTGALNTTFIFNRKLTLFALADFATGFHVLDYASVWSAFNGIDRTEPVVRYDLEGNEDGTFRFTTPQGAGVELLKDGDFLKLREVALRYVLPERLAEGIGARTASLSLSGRNLLTWTRDHGNARLDPELVGVSNGDGGLELGGVQSVTLPPPRQYRLGVQVTF